MSAGNRKIAALIILLLAALFIVQALLLSGRTEYGFNMMQTRNVSYGNERSRESLANMKKTGAETVAFVVFFKQKTPRSSELEPAWDKQYLSLRQSIRWAKELGLSTGIKPQLLVENSWSGAIKPDNWRKWFAVYTGYLYELAVLAEVEEVDFLVIGTELKQSTSLSYWIDLIETLRAVYSGELSYTAHGTDGLASFRFWSLLDSASVSLYPALGESDAEMHKVIRQTMESLSRLSETITAPVWIAEIGIASRSKARLRPWAWQGLADDEKHVDTAVQAEVISAWLDEIAESRIRRVLLWAWYSDPAAGGNKDIGYTIQNKPAEKLVSCRWGGKCV